MSRQAITRSYQSLLTRWPVDRLRPETQHFQHLLKNRIEAAPTPPRNETAEVRSATLLFDNIIARTFPPSKSIMEPTSNPEHYKALAKELEELPDRTWFGTLVKRMQNLIRLR